MKVRALLDAAYEYVQDSEYAQALALYEQALLLRPESASILSDIGATLLRMGRPGQAARRCRQALRIDPRNCDALLNLGAALHSESRYFEAIACYDEILDSAECAMAHAYKGLSLGEAGMLEKAVASFERALELDSQNELASESLRAAQEMSAKTR